jgi:hypothetical protein
LMSIIIFEFQCPSCRLDGNFKICCGLHDMNELDTSRLIRRGSSTAVRSTVRTPVISKKDVDIRSGTPRCYARMEHSSDFLCFYCTQSDSWGRYGGIHMVGAVTDPESPRIRGDLYSITAFRFQVSCGPECRCATYFDVQVTDQELPINEYSGL